MKIKVTNTVKRTALWYSIVMFLIYLIFNAIILFEIHITLIDDLDQKLVHELEHILHTIEIDSNSVKFINQKELNEPEFKDVSKKSFFLQIYDKTGKIIIISDNILKYGNIDLGFPNKFSPYYFENANTEKYSLRTIYKELLNERGERIGFIQLSAVQSTFNTLLWEIVKFNLILIPVFIIIINIVSLFLAKKTFAPVKKIINTANSISASNLSERLTFESDSDDELGQIQKTLNSLFDRLEGQIKQISQFTDNASHQLMTPLTTMKTELEYLLKKKTPTDEYRETLEILIFQTDKMIMMVREMLIMSRNFENKPKTSTVFNLSKLLKKEIKSLFNDERITFDILDNIYIRGNSEYFSLAIQNLISNALKYSNKNVDVKVKLFRNNDLVVLRVEDKGIGISDEDKLKIFERFYRANNDEVQSIEGYGLGLSLVESVIKSMDGKIRVTDNEPSGSIFEIELPYLKLS